MSSERREGAPPPPYVANGRGQANGLYCIQTKKDICTGQQACELFSTEFVIYRHQHCAHGPGVPGKSKQYPFKILRHCSICVFSVNKKDYQRLYGPL